MSASLHANKVHIVHNCPSASLYAVYRCFSTSEAGSLQGQAVCPPPALVPIGAAIRAESSFHSRAEGKVQNYHAIHAVTKAAELQSSSTPGTGEVHIEDALSCGQGPLLKAASFSSPFYTVVLHSCSFFLLSCLVARST